MAEETKETNKTKKMQDVAHPNKTPASATSRPVIVKHKQLLQDPMMTPKASGDDDEQTKSTEEKDSKNHRATTMTPPTLKKEAEETEDNEETEDTEDTTDKDDTDSTTKIAQSTDSVLSADIDQKNKEDEKAKESDAKATKEFDEIRKHIEEKTYFVPIGQVSQHRARVHTFIAFLFLLVLVGLYLAIDYGLLLPEIELPYEVFAT